MIWMNNTLLGHMMYIIDKMTIRNYDTFYFSECQTYIGVSMNWINLPSEMMNYISEILFQSNIYFETIKLNQELYSIRVKAKWNPYRMSYIKQSFLEYAIKDILYEE